jgi:hypothetical protein
LDNMSGVRNQRLRVFYPATIQLWYSRRSHGILLMPRTSYLFSAFVLLMRKTSAHSSAIECVVPTEAELFLFSGVIHCLVFSPFKMTRALSRCCQSLVLDHSYVVAYAESYTVQVARSVRVRCFVQTNSWIYAASTSRIRRLSEAQATSIPICQRCIPQSGWYRLKLPKTAPDSLSHPKAHSPAATTRHNQLTTLLNFSQWSPISRPSHQEKATHHLSLRPLCSLRGRIW